MDIKSCEVQRKWRATTRPGRPGTPGEKRRVDCAWLRSEDAAKKPNTCTRVHILIHIHLCVPVCMCTHACWYSDVCIFRRQPGWGFWPKSCWVLPAVILLKLDFSWFIFRYFLYPGMPHIWLCPLLSALSLLPASLSITLRFDHVLSFHVDGGCSWIYVFLHGGAHFQRETKNDFTACCVEYEFVDGQGESSKH